VLSVEPRSVLRSYAFFVGALMFGLPLLISYYAVSEGLEYATSMVVIYLLSSLAVGLLLLFRKRPPGGESVTHAPAGTLTGTRQLSRAGPYVALSFATIAVASFGLMKYLINSSYPYPSPSADLAGGVYLVSLGIAAVVGVPFAVAGLFPVVREALQARNLRIVALVLGIAYFVTYEILVNEIVITGYNTIPNNYVPSPSSNYPWVYFFTSGPSPGNLVEAAIYTPYVLVQLNQYVNLVFQPFEVLLAVVMSVLVASTVVVTYHTIGRSERMGGACSTSATLSGVGAFLGYTATCPSCLAPTLISVVFGGFASVQQFYSNLWGAVLPPLLSIIALTLSLAVLEWNHRRTAGAAKPTPGSTMGL
jgi:hypothetical protein